VIAVNATEDSVLPIDDRRLVATAATRTGPIAWLIEGVWDCRDRFV
jgi:hypothetical protein